MLDDAWAGSSCVQAIAVAAVQAAQAKQRELAATQAAAAGTGAAQQTQQTQQAPRFASDLQPGSAAALQFQAHQQQFAQAAAQHQAQVCFSSIVNSYTVECLCWHQETINSSLIC